MSQAALVCLISLLISLVAGVQDLAVMRQEKDVAIRPAAEIPCSLCVSFMQQSVQQILNIILQVGIAGGCTEVCGMLPNKYEAGLCVLICEYVGVNAFSELITDVDPDPVWICMEIDACPSSMNAAAKITSMKVTPPVDKIGHPMVFTMNFTVINQTGMTDVALVILSPKNEGIRVKGDWIFYSQAPGKYGQTVKFTPKPNQHDPFPPGVYAAVWLVCEGPCGCTHSLCYTMDTQQTPFKLTN